MIGPFRVNESQTCLWLSTFVCYAFYLFGLNPEVSINFWRPCKLAWNHAPLSKQEGAKTKGGFLSGVLLFTTRRTNPTMLMLQERYNRLNILASQSRAQGQGNTMTVRTMKTVMHFESTTPTIVSMCIMLNLLSGDQPFVSWSHFVACLLLTNTLSKEVWRCINITIFLITLHLGSSYWRIISQARPPC